MKQEQQGEKPYVVVIGGANIDIGGQAFEPLVLKDSNPGTISMKLGGVGRNIAHNMSLLGLHVCFITAFGEDVYAAKIASSCNELGIDSSPSMHVQHGFTSTYLFIEGKDGDMEAAIADMALYEQITPEFLQTREYLLQEAQVIVVDTNIPENSIAWIAKHCRTPIFVDPVSTTKAMKLQAVLGLIHTLKPNLLEAEILSGVKITDRVTLYQAVDVLLATGLQRVFISMGKQGVMAADHRGCKMLPCIKTTPVGMTGCGDAFMAALVWAYLNELELEESAKAGLAAASLCIEYPETVNPNLNQKHLKERANFTEYSVSTI
ncbi:pseudouridine kinase [Propionispira arboris]|uniref:Pseudouridine kinase n=1 Tax=Propionispira arboris TaxID=84035 RepID=A0A1H6Y9S9_9FIRM|nr:carbohydrate kinase family protein [Propionispira arboris]SEJ33952.1 pseudouridine kinase [Propionispira arboris]